MWRWRWQLWWEACIEPRVSSKMQAIIKAMIRNIYFPPWLGRQCVVRLSRKMPALERDHQYLIWSDHQYCLAIRSVRRLDQRCSVPNGGLLKISVFHEKLPDMRQLRSTKFGDWIKYDQHQTGKKSKYWCLTWEPARKMWQLPASGGRALPTLNEAKTLHLPFNLFVH